MYGVNIPIVSKQKKKTRLVVLLTNKCMYKKEGYESTIYRKTKLLKGWEESKEREKIKRKKEENSHQKVEERK